MKIGAKELAAKAMRERNYEAAQKAVKTSRGGGESRPAKRDQPDLGNPTGESGSRLASRRTDCPAGVASGPRETKPKASKLPRADAEAHVATPKVRADKAVAARTAGLIPATGAKPKVGRPRIEDRDKTLAARKPWAALGMSESTWRRRQAEKQK